MCILGNNWFGKEKLFRLQINDLSSKLSADNQTIFNPINTV